MPISSERLQVLKLIAQADAPDIELVLETLATLHDIERQLRMRRRRG